MGACCDKTPFHLRPLAEVATQRDVVVLRSRDATVHRLGPGHVGKYSEQVLQLLWRKSRVLILVQNIQTSRRSHVQHQEKKNLLVLSPTALYLVVLLEEPLEELITEMIQLCRTTDRYTQPGNANAKLKLGDGRFAAKAEVGEKTELTADRGSRL